MPPHRRYGPRDVYERPGALYNDVLRFYRPSGNSVIARVASARRRLEELRDDLAYARVQVRDRERLQSERAYFAIVIRGLLRAKQYLDDYIELEASSSYARMRAAVAGRSQQA